LREAAPRPQLICVDQEGGRVQRFRPGYTALPALQGFDALYREPIPTAALALAREHAWLMASEIRATGIDLSFAPVVDLGRGNRAIGNRAFSADPDVVAAFARTYVAGMHEAGMAATLKHFPGHGSVPGGHAFRCRRWTTVRWRRCAPPTWCRSSPASPPAPRR
jgi:beta-N-acetylhexosaminidase